MRGAPGTRLDAEPGLSDGPELRGRVPGGGGGVCACWDQGGRRVRPDSVV